MKVYVSYIRENCHWSFTIERGKGLAKVKAVSADPYPATKAGVKAMKRDCSEIVSHLRKNKDEIIISRYK